MLLVFLSSNNSRRVIFYQLQKKTYFGKSTWVIGDAWVHFLLLQNKNPSAERKIVTITTKAISSKVSNEFMITSKLKAFSRNCTMTVDNLQSVLEVSFAF